MPTLFTMTLKHEEEIETVCELLDKVTLKQLHLMEEKMQCEVNIESSINNGSIHLAKTRYIMGHSSVSATQLPTESSNEFSASTLCETIDEDGTKQLRLLESSSESTVNPLRWFGVLVPQNLHKAQNIFQNAINFVVECVNVQLQLDENYKNIEMLRKYKNTIGTKCKIIKTIRGVLYCTAKHGHSGHSVLCNFIHSNLK